MKISGTIISISSFGSNFIRIYLRDENRNKHKLLVGGFKPYFYIPLVDKEICDISEVKKIYTKTVKQIVEERKKYERTMESDIPFVRRFMIDTGITTGLTFEAEPGVFFHRLNYKDVRPYNSTSSKSLKKMYLDIEVLSSKNFVSPEDASSPVVALSLKVENLVITICYKDNIVPKNEKEGEWYIIYVDNEERLFEIFDYCLKVLDPDLLIGWNIAGYDYLYLMNRYKIYGKKLYPDRYEIFDLYLFYKFLFHQPSYKLKRVMIEEGLLDTIPELYIDVMDSYNTDIKRFLSYNRKDVEYLELIENKHNIFDFFFQLRSLVGTENYEKLLVHSILIDIMFLKTAKAQGKVLPSLKKKSKNIKSSYKGGYVFSERRGMYEGVGVFDFARYYPNLMLSFNITPENFEGDKKIEIKELLTRKKAGLVQEFLLDMFKEREMLENLIKQNEPGSEMYKSLLFRRQAVKGITNAVYGYFAYSGSRLFKQQMSEMITTLGREGLHCVLEISEEEGYKPLLADTDSIMIQIPKENIEDTRKLLNKKIYEHFKEKYGVEVSISLKYEKYVGLLFLSGKKKKYAMRVIEENGKVCDYKEVRGYENIRTDQSVFTRELMEEIFDLILFSKPTREDIYNFIKEKREKFNISSIYDIAITKGLQRPLHKYKTNTAYVRGAKYMNENFNTNFGSGSKVMYVWVKRFALDVFVFDEDTDIPSNLVIDKEKMFKICVLDKVRDILLLFDIDSEHFGKRKCLM